MKDTILLPRKAPIGSSSRSSTDLTYLHHDMEQRAQPPARREWFSAARPRTEFRCRCSSTASGRREAMSAACSGVFLTSAVKEQPLQTDSEFIESQKDAIRPIPIAL